MLHDKFMIVHDKFDGYCTYDPAICTSCSVELTSFVDLAKSAVVSLYPKWVSGNVGEWL